MNLPSVQVQILLFPERERATVGSGVARSRAGFQAQYGQQGTARKRRRKERAYFG